MEYKVISIQPRNLSKVMPYVIEYLKEALKYCDGEYDIKSLIDVLMVGKMQLWIVGKEDKIVGAATTEIIDYPMKRKTRIVLLSGKDLSKWIKPFGNTMEQWCRSVNAQSCEVVGRKGWQKRLKAIGFKPTYTILNIAVEEYSNGK